MEGLPVMGPFTLFSLCGGTSRPLPVRLPSEWAKQLQHQHQQAAILAASLPEASLAYCCHL